jgi:hypothetical protein
MLIISPPPKMEELTSGTTHATKHLKAGKIKNYQLFMTLKTR